MTYQALNFRNVCVAATFSVLVSALVLAGTVSAPLVA